LPEHNPLYLEMYVKEYLTFIGSSYQLRNIKSRVAQVIELCGLQLEQTKKIGALSKGYRQRVGLAQALIHDPEVLILDEPTSGLDPNQLAEIRDVIKEASSNKTVIFSTHIMQEVEALCDKVVIINKGVIVADDDVKTLKKKVNDKISYLVDFESTIDITSFDNLGIEISAIGNESYMFSSEEDPRKVIMKVVSDNSLPLVSISRNEQSLEGVFRELTAN
ncbi:MAG: ATP-binding cassette domain-containing protein, partial [Bacteroidota bacterium]